MRIDFIVVYNYFKAVRVVSNIKFCMKPFEGSDQFETDFLQNFSLKPHFFMQIFNNTS